MSEPRPWGALRIKSPRPSSHPARHTDREAAVAPTSCSRASGSLWGPPRPCTLSQVRDLFNIVPLTTPSGQDPGDHQGDSTALRPRVVRWGPQVPLTADGPVPSCPPALPWGWGARCRHWGLPLQPQVRSLGNYFLQAHHGLGGGGGRRGSNVHTYPVAPPSPASSFLSQAACRTPNS